MTDETSKKTILIVDDAPANIDLLKGLLREHYRIKAATSGQKALAVAAKAPPPDLILLDVMMPDLDGYETCRRLKADPVTADIPVFFVTGRLDPDERATGLRLDALDYILKPVDPERLLERIAAVLDTHS
ncbi:MAG: response regulator [Chromatiales bacterium]|nr:response regulator [Chromatiales bacterium]